MSTFCLLCITDFSLDQNRIKKLRIHVGITVTRIMNNHPGISELDLVTKLNTLPARVNDYHATIELLDQLDCAQMQHDARSSTEELERILAQAQMCLPGSVDLSAYKRHTVNISKSNPIGFYIILNLVYPYRKWKRTK